MFDPNQVKVKLAKSLSRLQLESVLSKKLPSQYVLSSQSIISSTNVHLEKENGKMKALLGEQQKDTTNYEAKKHVFRRPVACNSLINSNDIFMIGDPQVSNSISLINKVQIEKNCRLTFFLKSPINISTCAPLISAKYLEHSMDNCNRLCLSSAKYSTCPPQPPCCVGRHRYHEETENAINQQILAELNACYAYLSMACYFGRTEIALPGCQIFFMKMHKEEHEHALVFINYQLMRGGHVKLCPLTIPECQDWESIHKALAVAVEMEKLVKEKLVQVYNTAEKHHDLHIMDLITTKFIEEQERSICEISRLLMRATNMGCSGVAQYLFDKEVHRAAVKKSSKNQSMLEDTENKSDLYV